MMTTHRFGTTILALAVVAALCVGREAKADLVYFSTSDQFGTVDTSTGSVNIISSSTPTLIGLQNVGGQIYGEGSGSGELYQVDKSTGAATGLGAISSQYSGAGETIYVSGPSGPTYELSGDTAVVYTLMPPSTTETPTNLSSFTGSVYNTRLYAVGSDGQIYGIAGSPYDTQTLDILNPTTGVLTTGPVLSQNFGNYNGVIFFDSANLDLLDSQGLYTINMTTGDVAQDFAFSGGELGRVWSASELASATVPEPSSLALCGLGLAGLAGWARRRRADLGS